MDIRAIDPSTATDAELRAQYELFTAVQDEAVPDDERQPFEDWQGWIRISPPARKTYGWHAYEGDRLVGFSFFEFWEEEVNQNAGAFWVDVRRDARRRGVATRLVEPLLATAREHGRTLLAATAHPRIEGSAAFLESLGGRHAFTGRTNLLRVDDLDLGLLQDWIDRAKERASGYDLEWLDSPVSDDRIEALVNAQYIMNTAPHEDYEVEDDVFTVKAYRDEEAVLAVRRIDQWILAAIDRASGAIAGYTRVALPQLWPTRAYQGDTGVDPAHRDKGLGRWLKAKMALRIIHERPAVRAIETGNAASNVPMLAINDALGFRCLDERLIHQIAI